MATWGPRALVLATVASTVLTACAGNIQTPTDGGTGKAAKGRTLTYYIPGETDKVDPQRVYSGREMSFLARAVYRSLVTFPVSQDVDESLTTVPDLATDTGRAADGARTWAFTLRDGATWEDGKDVTCEDLKYGASRVFATDVIKGGPTYLLSYLDVPTDPRTDQPIYTGPYQSTPEGQAAFDKAITCDDRTITYHFKKPWLDFPLAVASLHMADPYRRDKDRGARSAYQIFSNGPYKLQGAWNKEKGGLLVRNKNYDPSTDASGSRKALPDRIAFVAGPKWTAEQITDRLIADDGRDRAAVAAAQVPAAYYGRITGDVAKSAVTAATPYTTFLVPNVRRLTDVRVRQALAASTDVTAWVRAGGGDKDGKASTDVVSPVLPGYQEGLFASGSGDPAKARQLLEQAGVQTPYPITFAYPSYPTTDQQAAAIKAGWEEAGFTVTLDGHKDYEEYFEYMRRPDKPADVVLSDWGPDWPSAIAVIPPVFDSRANLTETSTGADVGSYQSDEFNALVDRAQQAEGIADQTRLLQAADQVLAQDVAYIPLTRVVFYLLHGSDVTGYLSTAASNGFPDLGAIGVK